MQGSTVEDQKVERAYRAHRREVLAMLRCEFAGVPDHEEIYQEAWAEALELQARGKEIVNLGGLLRTIAWRRARDYLRDWAPVPLDPTSVGYVSQIDEAALPEECVEAKISGALIRQIVESLDPREAAVIKLRFDAELEPHEIQRELGLSQKLFEKILTQAYKRVGEALAEREPGSLEWHRRQRSLLMACETGVASARQRIRAARFLRDDPACRAMLTEIRATLETVAGILPAPLAVEAMSRGRAGQLRLALSERFGLLRDHAADALSRVSGNANPIEQAGAGSIATLGGGAVLKATLVCVAITGTTVVCLTGGSVRQKNAPPVPNTAARRAVKEPAPPRQVPVAPPVSHVGQNAANRAKHEKAVQVAAAPPPSPAPSGSTEFGPGAVGSTRATSTPAAAPAGGGGEFGP